MIKTFNIYNTPALYDDQYWWKRDDIEFYKQIFSPQSIVLELGSGTGRLAFPLIRNDVEYYGLELSDNFCRYTRDKLISHDHKSKIIQGDMRDFNIRLEFDYIFIAFNTFLHILTNEDAMKCFKCIKNHLKNGGEFIFDIALPDPSFLHKDKIEPMLVMDFKDTKELDTVEIYEQCVYNNQTEICDISWEYRYKNCPEKNKKFEFQMRMFYPDTMNRLLIEAGFDIDSVYGDYEKNRFSESSPLQIYRCR